MAFARPENIYMLAAQLSPKLEKKKVTTPPSTTKLKVFFNNDTLQNEAKNSAIKYVAHILQRPDQLDKIEQHTKRIHRKKVMVEALLKSMIQSYLEGVSKGLTQLQDALKDIKSIKERIKGIKETYKDVAPLVIKLKDIKDESHKHNQFASAVENLKHIFNVPEIIKKANIYLNDGNLLHAHQCIQDLERSRDDLLWELHSQPTPNPIDINMIHRYYEDLQDLNARLTKQLLLIGDRLIPSTRKEPTLVVTMVRIIEREEKNDFHIRNRTEFTGFNPPGRPKDLKRKFFEVLTASIRNSLEGTQSEDRIVSNVWLVKHLEMIRLKYLDDLRVIKKILPPCFPDTYNIFHVMTNLYHKALSYRLKELVDDNLEGNEIITLLTWIKDYDGRDLLGHPDLQIADLNLPPLLEQSVKDNLIEKYLQTMQNNVQEWMRNTVKSDSKDWYSEKIPDMVDGYFYNTQMPFVLHDMCKQNIKVAEQVSQNLTTKAVHLLVNQMSEFANLYSEALKEYHNKHIVDRKYPHYFIHYTMAVIDNCQSFGDFMVKLRDDVVDPEEQDDMDKSILQMKLNKLVKTLDKVADRGCSYLLEEVFLDLETHFQNLMTKDWLTDKNLDGVIRATIDDYAQDYVHLKPRYFVRIVMEAENRVVLEYLKGMIAKRYVFKSFEERKEACEKLSNEAANLINFFNELRSKPIKILSLTDPDLIKHYKTSSSITSPLDMTKLESSAPTQNNATCLIVIAEILKMKDTTLLTLEISGLLAKFKDVSYDNLCQILSIRGDLSKPDIKNILLEIMPENVAGSTSQTLGIVGLGSTNPLLSLPNASSNILVQAARGVTGKLTASASALSLKHSPSFIEPEKSIFSRLNDS